MAVNEVKLSGGIHGCAGDGEEAIFQLYNFGAGRQHRGGIARRGFYWIGGNVEHGEFTFAHFQMMGHVLDCILVRVFTDPQECAATIRIADSISALGIDMQIAEMNVLGMVETNRCGKGARERVTR